jgi:hypothetical protein
MPLSLRSRWQKDQEDSRAEPDAYSDAEASKDFSKKSVAHTHSHCFCETKESLANSIPDSEE